MKWRGNSGGENLGESLGWMVNWQCLDTKEPHSAKGFMPINITFPMNYDGRALVVTGSKFAKLALREGADAPWVLKRKWEELEVANSAPQAGPPSVPQAGPILSSGSKVVEEAPAWAYDVRGYYKGTKAFGILGPFHVKAEDILLEVKLSNNPAHSKVKRQLWANVWFGYELKGGCASAP